MRSLRADLLVVLLAVGVALPAQAQELFCDVRVNYNNLQGSDFTFLDNLDEEMEEYLNRRAWTTDSYQEMERIDCTIQVIFTESITLTSFRARLIVASRRPIYGTSATTTVMQINDEDWQFEYSQGTPLVFDLERYNPLTSVINFYAYLILGYDYDTFGELGGNPHFERARRIAERAQSAPGWEDLGADRGRTTLIRQLLEPRYHTLRRAYYAYHYGGLDRFVIDTEQARQTVLDALAGIEELTDQTTRDYIMDLFFAAKNQELTSIFEESSLQNQAYTILSDIDPANLATYDKLVN